MADVKTSAILHFTSYLLFTYFCMMGKDELNIRYHKIVKEDKELYEKMEDSMKKMLKIATDTKEITSSVQKIMDRKDVPESGDKSILIPASILYDLGITSLKNIELINDNASLRSDITGFVKLSTILMIKLKLKD